MVTVLDPEHPNSLTIDVTAISAEQAAKRIEHIKTALHMRPILRQHFIAPVDRVTVGNAAKTSVGRASGLTLLSLTASISMCMAAARSPPSHLFHHYFTIGRTFTEPFCSLRTSSISLRIQDEGLPG